MCTACQLGKSSRLSLIVTPRSSTLLSLVFTDEWGPSPILTSDGYRYFIISVDDFFKFIWFFPMKNKSDAFPIFNKFQAYVERQFNAKIKVVQSDYGANIAY